MYIKIKDKEIPIRIRNYEHSCNIRIFFKNNILNISKPIRVSDNEIFKIIEDREEEIYKQYIEIMSNKNNGIKQWTTGEKILYKGEEYNIVREYSNEEKIKIKIDTKDKVFSIQVPSKLSDTQIKINVDNGIKGILKSNTKVMLQDRLPYWSNITKINYKSVNVRDATTRFGSCVPVKKALYFNSRLIMLPQDKIDAIIVHELCHIVHGNHSKDFYNLVKKYITNYDEIDKWLKDNNNMINI